MCGIQLGSHSYGENPANSWIFCILKLSNVLFQQTTKTYDTMYYCKREGNAYGTGKEQINCRFIGAMFVCFFVILVCALPCISMSAHTKELCSATLIIESFLFFQMRTLKSHFLNLDPDRLELRNHQRELRRRHHLIHSHKVFFIVSVSQFTFSDL